MNETFSVRDTNICKGIAIVLMVVHHVVCKGYDTVNLNWYFENSNDIWSLLTLFISSAGKVCVSLLTILAGYGMYKKYITCRMDSTKTSEIKFVLSRIVKFYSVWIPIWLLFLIIKYVTEWDSLYCLINFYNRNGGGLLLSIILMIKDILGLNGMYLFQTPSVNGNWYVSTIVILYILFPIIRSLTIKYRWKFVVLCNIPWIYLMLKGGIKSNVWCCYVTEFALGILLSDTRILDQLKCITTSKYKVYSLIFLILAWILRLIFALPIDIILAFAIIVFETQWFRKHNLIFKTSLLLGINSANMWLIHEQVISITKETISSTYILILVVICLSLLMSILIEKIKILTRFYVLVNKIIQTLLNNKDTNVTIT